MASVTAPARRSLLGHALVAFQARPSRISSLAAKVREHVVTVAAMAAIDVGAFHVPYGWGTAVGCVVTGLSLLVLDFAFTGK